MFRASFHAGHTPRNRVSPIALDFCAFLQSVRFTRRAQNTEARRRPRCGRVMISARWMGRVRAAKSLLPGADVDTWCVRRLESTQRTRGGRRYVSAVARRGEGRRGAHHPRCPARGAPARAPCRTARSRPRRCAAALSSSQQQSRQGAKESRPRGQRKVATLARSSCPLCALSLSLACRSFCTAVCVAFENQDRARLLLLLLLLGAAAAAAAAAAARAGTRAAGGRHGVLSLRAPVALRQHAVELIHLRRDRHLREKGRTPSACDLESIRHRADCGAPRRKP